MNVKNKLVNPVFFILTPGLILKQTTVFGIKKFIVQLNKLLMIMLKIKFR